MYCQPPSPEDERECDFTVQLIIGLALVSWFIGARRPRRLAGLVFSRGCSDDVVKILAWGTWHGRD
jgi:hypothetical protein